METEEARRIVASVLTEGVTTPFNVGQCREAHTALMLDSLLFTDARIEAGAMMILEAHISSILNHTTEV